MRPGVCLYRAGERALLVAEQLALEQRLGDGRAVDRDEAPVAAGRRLVQRARQQFLAGARLAEQQHRRRGGAHPFDHAADLAASPGAPVRMPLASSPARGLQPAVLRLQLVHAERAVDDQRTSWPASNGLAKKS